MYVSQIVLLYHYQIIVNLQGFFPSHSLLSLSPMDSNTKVDAHDQVYVR